MKITEVTDKWELAANSAQAQGHIHPLGNVDERSYDESGKAQALEVARVSKRYLKNHYGCRVADFGCGDGRVTRHLSEAFSTVDVWGIDASPTMIQRLADRVPDVNGLISNGVDGVTDGLGADVLFSYAVFIHHDIQGGAELLSGLAEAIDQGSILALQIPCYSEPRERQDWTDVTVWTLDLLEGAADEAGLKILESHESLGTFDYKAIGENHHRLQVLGLA